MADIIPIGAETKWGKVSGVGFRDGERHYLLTHTSGTVSLMPAAVVEEGYDVWLRHRVASSYSHRSRSSAC